MHLSNNWISIKTACQVRMELVASMEQADIKPWDWTAYFDLFTRPSRKCGLCNLHYVDYAMERLEICLGSISLPFGQFNDALRGQHSPEEETQIYH